MTLVAHMHVEGFFDRATSTVSYIVLDSATRRCAVVDCVLDYEPSSGRTNTISADRLVARIYELQAKLEWILETHVHGDHLSAAPYLKECLGGRIAIGERITAVQQELGDLFNAGDDFARDGSQFDHLFKDSESFTIGGLQARAMHTPGHTLACVSYVVTDEEQTAVFVGDSLFMPDYGTGRCDFPGGDARTLYQSINKLLAFPPETKLYLCHDYQPGGRGVKFMTTVGDQRRNNIHVRDGVSEEEFVSMRTARDATLTMPALMLPSVQVNMRGGQFPNAEPNGKRYIKIPVDSL